MKRRILALVLTLVMTIPTVVFAEDITINVNGVNLETDQPPVIENGRTLVPLRAVAEALGCQVEWDNTTKTANFSQGEVSAVITVGESYILVGDGVYNEEFPIDSPAIIKNSRTLIPLRALSECFGYDVKWDNDTRTVTISSKSMEIGDTDSAEEQEKIEVSDNMLGKIKAYAGILEGTVKIIDAVEYENEIYGELKAELGEIILQAENMTYDELIAALSKLKEVDSSFADIANDAGVSDIVAEYYSGCEESLSEIMGE